MIKRAAVLNAVKNNRLLPNGSKDLMRTRRLNTKNGRRKGGLVMPPMNVFARALYFDDVLKDFGPEDAFSLSELGFQIPVGQAKGREMSALKPTMIYPFLVRFLGMKQVGKDEITTVKGFKVEVSSAAPSLLRNVRSLSIRLIPYFRVSLPHGLSSKDFF